MYKLPSVVNIDNYWQCSNQVLIFENIIFFLPGYYFNPRKVYRKMILDHALYGSDKS